MPYTTTALFDLDKTIASELLQNYKQPWDALNKISGHILALGANLSPDLFTKISNDIWIAKSATVAHSALINGPCIIDENAEIRHCAYIRGNTIIGKNTVVGNSTELKNCILFDNVQVPHFNYVGDSILGYKSHLGAGAVTSNVKSDKTKVQVKANGTAIDTGLTKMGAMVGDNVEIGCNSVLNPGTIIGRESQVYPTSCVRGVVPANCIVKANGDIIRKY